ncbi:MAG TPA: electron transfer flavoprotein subunit beta/FixA family protein [Chloroflexia bacterium]|nr:electron transfer flavoprotein subunit beta/FixA family protein [Chloroflexia bacterium]
MNIVVCVKQVPNPTGTNRIDPNTLRIMRDGTESVLDPADEFSVEAALQIMESQPDVNVTVVSMGPDRALEAIRRGLAMGATKGVHISDPALAGSDALTTAKVLAAAIKRENPDLVLCATESSDAYTGMVPGGIAQHLGFPLLSYAKKLTVGGGKATIERQTENGYQVVEAQLPAVVTVTGSINTPRYPALKGIMQAKKKPVDTLTAASLGFSAEQVGEKGAKEKVLGWAPAEQRKAGTVIKDDGTAAAQIADFLAQLKVI